MFLLTAERRQSSRRKEKTMPRKWVWCETVWNGTVGIEWLFKRKWCPQWIFWKTRILFFLALKARQTSWFCSFACSFNHQIFFIFNFWKKKKSNLFVMSRHYYGMFNKNHFTGMWFICFFIVCLFHSRLLFAAANQIICICGTWYCSRLTRRGVLPLLCAVHSVVLHPSQLTFQSLHCVARCAGQGTMAFFCITLSMSKCLQEFFFFFFFTVQMRGRLCCAVTVWMPCFDAGMLWHCVECDWHSLCVWSKQNVQNWSSGSPATVSCLLQSLCVCDSSNSGFFFTDLDDAAAGCASHCVSRLFFCRPKPSGNSEEMQRLVPPTAMCNWECTENVPTH